MEEKGLNDRLKFFLNTMDVPPTRRDVTKPANVRWLNRNLAAKNAEHPDFESTIKLLREAMVSQ
jgi:hypothetical protein